MLAVTTPTEFANPGSKNTVRRISSSAYLFGGQDTPCGEQSYMALLSMVLLLFRVNFFHGIDASYTSTKTYYKLNVDIMGRSRTS